MDYARAIDYLLSQSDLERDSSPRTAQNAFQVDRMGAFLEWLGRPDAGRLTVHVAGSKGKGSTASMAAQVLSEAGERTGLYTSPHLHSFCERIAVDGEPIPEGDFGRLVGELSGAAESGVEAGAFGRITTFEHLTALAFLYFRDRGCTAQAVEVGLGGRLDATNAMVHQDVCVLAPISLEHTEILGATVDRIAGEKAGILRPGVPAVIAPQRHREAYDVLRARAEALGCPVVDVAAEYRWRRTEIGRGWQAAEVAGVRSTYAFNLPLLGEHQVENAATAIAAVEALAPRLDVAPEAVERGLARVRWPGRMEVIGRDPLVVLDGAHNRDSAERLAEGLREYFHYRQLILVVGVSKGKDLDGIADELAPLTARVICTQSTHPRAAPPEEIVPAFLARGLPTETAPDVQTALALARLAAAGDDLICVMGSLFIVAEARESILGIPHTAGSLV